MKLFALVLICYTARAIVVTHDIPTLNAKDSPGLIPTGGSSDAESIMGSKETQPRELSQVVVEEIKKKKKASKKDKVMKGVNKLVDQFGLDRKLSMKKVNQYFNKLGKKMYRNFKKTVVKDKDFIKEYDSLLQEYNSLSNKYRLK